MSSNKASAGKRTDKQGSSTLTTADAEKSVSLALDASEYIRSAKMKEATEKLTQAITLNPHPVLFSTRAGVYCYFNEHDNATKDCHTALELDPKCDKAYGYLALIFERQKLYKEAIEAYKKALEFDPLNEQYKANLASVEEKLKVIKQESSPPSAEVISKANALKEEGNAFMKSSKFKEAIEKYTEAIVLKRDHVYLCNRAAAHCGLKQYEHARKDGLEAISIDDKYAKAYGRIAFSASCLGRLFYAVRLYNKALQLDPNNEYYKENLALAEEKLREMNQQP